MSIHVEEGPRGPPMRERGEGCSVEGGGSLHLRRPQLVSGPRRGSAGRPRVGHGRPSARGGRRTDEGTEEPKIRLGRG
jgi:hypothetical protein